MENNILLGILSGSVGTLIIKEIFNQYNKRFDYKKDIEKITYIRKIETAEKAISFYTTYMYSLGEIKSSFETILKGLSEDIIIDADIVQNIIESSGNQLDILMNTYHKDSNAVHLYFDLENLSLWNENDISKMIENFAETKNIDNEISIWLESYNKSIEENNTKKADVYWLKIEELIPKYQASLQKLINSFEKNKIAIRNIIIEIKKQL